MRSLTYFMIFLSGITSAQEDLSFSELDLERKLNAVKSDAGRELQVIAPTLTEEELEPAVLNRLLHEISREPEKVKSRLNIDDETLEDIFIALTNARSFINTNEMANIRAMCQTWSNSDLVGDDKINQALAAYEHRAGFTNSFIARFYKIVLADIKHGLMAPSLLSFENYLDDRRRRMANAGTVTTRIATQNARSGEEAVYFHCGPGR